MKHGFTISDLERKQAAGKIKGFVVEQKTKSPTPAGEEKKKKRAKYGNNKHEIDGILFDSKKEAGRYLQLKLMLYGALIGNLELQKEYKLIVDGKLVCKYIADFVYVKIGTGETIVEDVKSAATRKLPAYRLKKKLMRAIFNIEIIEV